MIADHELKYSQQLVSLQASQVQPESGSISQLHSDGGQAPHFGIQSHSGREYLDNLEQLQHESSPYMQEQLQGNEDQVQYESSPYFQTKRNRLETTI